MNITSFFNKRKSNTETGLGLKGFDHAANFDAICNNLNAAKSNWERDPLPIYLEHRKKKSEYLDKFLAAPEFNEKKYSIAEVLKAIDILAYTEPVIPGLFAEKDSAYYLNIMWGRWDHVYRYVRKAAENLTGKNTEKILSARY